MLIAFNKPFNVLCQFTDGAGERALAGKRDSPQSQKTGTVPFSSPGRRTLADFVTVKDVYPAGRLDYDSEGLLLLTDDGALQKRIADPRHKMKKTYLAQVEGLPDEKALTLLRRGVKLKEGTTRPAGAQRVDEPDWLWPRLPPIRHRLNVPTAWLEITLTEGRNRQVRRMTAAVGHPTLRLVRVSIGEWSLGGLRPGESEKRQAPGDRR